MNNKEIIQKYIDKHNKYVEKIKNKEEFTDDEAELFWINGRKLIEGLFKLEINENRKITNYILDKKNKKFNEYSYAWSIINDENHAFRESNTSIDENSLNEINKILFFLFSTEIFKKYNLKANNININFNEEWEEISSSKKKYDAFIYRKINYNNSYNTYEVGQEKKGNKQKVTHFYFLNKEEELLIYNFYELEIITKKLKIGNTDINIERTFIINYKLKFKHSSGNYYWNNSLIELKKHIINKYGLTPLYLLKYSWTHDNHIWQENEEIQNLKKIFNEIFNNEEYDINYFLRQIILLKHSLKDVLKKSKLKNTPLIYEYWTKSNHGEKPLDLKEKEIIYEFFKFAGLLEKIDNEINFKNKNNKILSIKLEENNSYSMFKNHFNRDFLELLFKSGENTFWEKYSEYRAIEFNDKITLKKYRDLENIIKNFLTKEKVKIKGKKLLIDDDDDEGIKDKLNKVNKILNNNISIVTSPAGTGKTKLAGLIIKELKLRNETVIFLGPTHKAINILEDDNDIGDFDKKTIQKITWNDNENNCNENNCLEKYNNIIIDEFSMIEDDDWKKIIPKIKDKKRIIIMGDKKQIPPINSFGIHNLFNKEEINLNLINLKKNYRFKNDKMENQIKTFREKGFFESANFSDFVKTYSSPKEYVEMIENYAHYDSFLSPIKYGLFGTKEVTKIVKKRNDKNFEKNDKVLIVNENLKHDVDEFLHNLRELTIINIDEKNKNYIFKEKPNSGKTFENKKGWSYNSALEIFSYNEKKHQEIEKEFDFPFVSKKVITFHQSQGSTFKKTFIIVPPGWSKQNLEYRNKMIYTAISRSIDNFIIFIYNKDLNSFSENKDN